MLDANGRPLKRGDRITATITGIVQGCRQPDGDSAEIVIAMDGGNPAVRSEVVLRRDQVQKVDETSS